MDSNCSSGSGASTKGDEVEIVSRFLAPLCARDETARNIALAAARTTVEGWLGGMSSPNQGDDAAEMEQTGNFKGQNGRYDMNIERSPTKPVPKSGDHQYYHSNRAFDTHPPAYHYHLRDTFRTEGFFSQSVTDNNSLPSDCSLDNTERYPSGSFDFVDGRVGNEASNFPTSKDRWNHNQVEGVIDKLGNSTASKEASGVRIDNVTDKCSRERESRFSSSSESERRIFELSSNEKLNDTYQEESKQRLGRIKGARQKQLEDDDLDSDTRIYGKSPKFDDNMGNFGHFEANYGNYISKRETRGFIGFGDETSAEDENARHIRNHDGVVFNTLEGFKNRSMVVGVEQDALENMNLGSGDQHLNPQQGAYLRNTEERKFSAGQIKRPLSQDEDVSSKSGRVLEGPEVTPGDVGRMLNLGNALDGPRLQTQSNKYLSLVTLHLPVILRLSVNCPFQNVRTKCAEILQMVKERGLPIPQSAFDGPSAFIPTTENKEALCSKIPTGSGYMTLERCSAGETRKIFGAIRDNCSPLSWRIV